MEADIARFMNAVPFWPCTPGNLGWWSFANFVLSGRIKDGGFAPNHVVQAQKGVSRKPTRPCENGLVLSAINSEARGEALSASGSRGWSCSAAKGVRQRGFAGILERFVAVSRAVRLHQPRHSQEVQRAAQIVGERAVHTVL